MIEEYLNKVYRPPADSHKGENGKVLVIGGSKLFHAASIWAAETASKIVDMVFYSSIDENNQIVKGKFANGIIIPRGKVEDYIEEADSILIGPGLPRESGVLPGDENTRELTDRLLRKFPHKKWVIDGGSLQVIKPESLPKTAIVTPHHKEFEVLFGKTADKKTVGEIAQKFEITILLTGPVDIVSSPQKTIEMTGGNPGMTKGGTGDVLAGLVASLYSKNDAFTSAIVGSYINKKAGEALEKKQGVYFNATDLMNEIPRTMKDLL